MYLNIRFMAMVQDHHPSATNNRGHFDYPLGFQFILTSPIDCLILPFLHSIPTAPDHIYHLNHSGYY